MAVKPAASKAWRTLAATGAFFAAPVVWLLFQQGQGGFVYFACEASGPPLGLLAGLLAAAACSGAFVLALRMAYAPSVTPTLRFIGRVGAGMAAILLLAVVVMTVSIGVVPACAR